MSDNEAGTPEAPERAKAEQDRRGSHGAVRPLGSTTGNSELFHDLNSRVSPNDLVVIFFPRSIDPVFALAQRGVFVELHVLLDAQVSQVNQALKTKGFDGKFEVLVSNSDQPIDLEGTAHKDISEKGSTRKRAAKAVMIADTPDVIEVLASMHEELAQDRPLIYVEIDNENTLSVVSAWLDEREYTAWNTYGAEPAVLFIPIEELDRECMLAHIQEKSVRKDLARIREIRRLSQQLADAHLRLDLESEQLDVLSAEVATLKSQASAQLQHIATLATAATSTSKGKIWGLHGIDDKPQYPARSHIVLKLAYPLLKPHLSAQELRLYRTAPSVLFENAQHPMMIRVGKWAGYL